MKRGLMSITFTFIIYFVGVGQDRTVTKFRNDQIAGLNGQMTRVFGTLDDALPIELIYSTNDGACHGLIRFGSEDEINLEGECSDTTINLYEFDEFARVAGVITGNIKEGEYELTWSNHDHSLDYNINGRKDYIPTNNIKVYNIKDEEYFDHILLWEDNMRIITSQEDDVPLKWSDYYCPHAAYACHFQNDDDQKHDLSISDLTIGLGSNLYQLSEEVVIKNTNEHDFEYYYNFCYPYINEKKYNKFISDYIEDHIVTFKRTLPKKDVIHASKKDYELEDRLKNRAQGDFFITLINEDIISGYLTYHSTFQPILKTTSFSYDRNRNKFYNIRDIWNKDFNYSFFLKSFIENKKRDIIRKEEPIVKKELEGELYSHFAIAPQGILFFTEYHFIFGRRSILIPFEEISGFIDNKSLSKLINND